MIDYAKSGTQHNILVEFILDGLPVVPDSISYWLYDNANNIVDSIANVTAEPTGEAVIILIPDSANLRTKDIEYRRLYIEFSLDGMVYNINKHYFLKDTVFFPLNPSDVRTLIGIEGSELADELIDILTAYEELKSDASGLDLDTILQSGAVEADYIIKAVAYRSAMNCIGFLNNSIMKMEQADNTLYQRFEGFNFNDNLKRLASGYSKYASLLKGQTVATITYSIMAQGTDRVTGA